MAEAEAFTNSLKNANFDHQSLIDELDSLNHQLDEMKENVMKTSVRAHILEADIASLFDPEVAEAVETAVEKCDKCNTVFNEPGATDQCN